MPKVLCTLPNASDEISGVKFTEHAKGMLSEDLSDEQAAVFAAIPGYAVVGEKPAAPPAPVVPVVDDVRADLLARAEAIGFKVKSTWGNDRLANEVADAEKAAEAEKVAAAEKAAAAEAAANASGATQAPAA